MFSKMVTMVYQVCILHKSTADRYRPVRVADGPITARCRFIKNASWDIYLLGITLMGNFSTHLIKIGHCQ